MARLPLSPARRQGQVAAVLADWLASRNPNTSAAYTLDLDMFARWQNLSSVQALDRFFRGGRGAANATALRWMNHMTAEGKAPATVARRIAALHAVLRVARMYELVDWSLDVSPKRVVPHRDTRGPGREAFDRALAALARRSSPDMPTAWSGDRWRAARDGALLRLMHDLALRMSEALGLDLEHLALERASVWVLRKREAVRRLMTLPPETVSALSTWIAARRRAPGPLFLTGWRGGHRMTPRAVQRLTRQLGLGHPHGLRHLGITEALDRTGGDVRRVQRYSGHMDVNNVLRYDDNRRDVAGEVARIVAE